MSEFILVTGAGVDRTEGIGFPLADTLLTDVAKFLKNDGSDIDKALRKCIPGLRYNFNTAIARSIDQIVGRDSYQQHAMVRRVSDAVKKLDPSNEHDRKHGELIIKLFEQLAKIATENKLDADTEKLIQDVFPEQAEDWLDGDFFIDLDKASLSDTFKAVLKASLRMSIDKNGSPIATALGSDLLNIETLLVEKFLGFYNNKLSDIKSYLYISWSLWAYLVYKQNDTLNKHKKQSLPFYSTLPEDIKAITLNYTTFLENKLGSDRTIYFHGGLAEYVRMDTRDLTRIPDMTNIDARAFIEREVAPNIKVDGNDMENHQHIIPALVPPLKLKPVLSSNYIEKWSEASKLVQSAKKVVVVGYSFNAADEHFNDIIRCKASGSIDIVVPEATSDYFLARMEKIFQYPKSQMTVTKVQDRDARKIKNVRFIAAKAAEISVDALFKE